MGQKILVVEDNELNLKLFCDLLRAHGYEAEPVRDGREAVARARSFVPDLVVMDIQMPYITGLELIEQMKSDDELKRTPIMAVTAYAAKGDEERIREAGAEGYVSKPISLMRFIEAVRGLLAEAEGAEEVAETEEEAQSETVIPAEAGISGPEDTAVDGERPPPPPSKDANESRPETVIPAEAGISGPEETAVDGERRASAAAPPAPFTP